MGEGDQVETEEARQESEQYHPTAHALSLPVLAFVQYFTELLE